MRQETLSDIVQEQTQRALWEVKNVIDCIPDICWEKLYCEVPLWKHIYHMLHSLDMWFINPSDLNFIEPNIHEKDLNNLDAISMKQLTRNEINDYCVQTAEKISSYTKHLQDIELLQKPENCEYTKFTLILAQYRHLHTHMGMLMGFIIAYTNMWPRVVGLENPIPSGDFYKFFNPAK